MESNGTIRMESGSTIRIEIYGTIKIKGDKAACCSSECGWKAFVADDSQIRW